MKTKLLTAAEAAKLKGVSHAAIYAAIAQGRLPHQRILGHLALRERNVLTWTPKPHSGRRKGTPMSAESKARISAGQKRRWVERKGDASP